MSGWAEAEENEGHQEDQYIHRYVCGVLLPLRHYKVSRDLKECLWVSVSDVESHPSVQVFCFFVFFYHNKTENDSQWATYLHQGPAVPLN